MRLAGALALSGDLDGARMGPLACHMLLAWLSFSLLRITEQQGLPPGTAS
jgi:hypothetical protein